MGEYATPKVLLSSADTQVGERISLSEFRAHLITTLLFGGAAAVTDGFFFMNRHLVSELLSPGQGRDWIVALLRNGHIRPYFRQDFGGSFLDCYQEIRRQGVIGMVPRARRIAELLDRELESAPRYLPNTWPTNTLVGKQYLRALRLGLRGDCPSDEPDSIKVWQETERWRIDCVEQVLEPDGSVRRGNILDAVGSDLGLRLKRPVRNAGELLRLAKGHDMERYVGPFVSWLIQAYLKNQAENFRLEADLLAGKGSEQLYAIGTLPHATADSAYLVETLELLPSPQGLYALGPESILPILSSQAARDFFGARFAAGRATDPADSVGPLTDALSGYCRFIREVTKQKLDAPLRLMQVSTGWPSSSGPGAQLIANLLVSTATTFALPVGLVVWAVGGIVQFQRFFHDTDESGDRELLTMKDRIAFRPRLVPVRPKPRINNDRLRIVDKTSY